MKIQEEHVRYAVLGGTFLGGGGGGAWELGMRLGLEAIKGGDVVVCDINSLNPQDTLVSSAFVGAPSTSNANVSDTSIFTKSIKVFVENYKRKIAGLISNECGAVACVNGWLQSAYTKIPFVDAPCNGRAHPTGLMGAMGLHTDPHYQSLQVAVGKNNMSHQYTTAFYSGDIKTTSQLVRNFSHTIGEMVAVTRNPISVEYVKRHGAVGAISQAISLGKAMLDVKSKGPEAMVNIALGLLGGEIICRDKVSYLQLENKNGFDIGKIKVNNYYSLFCNEYLTLTNYLTGQRLATFPDLIMTIDAHTGYPVTTASIKQGQEIYVIAIPYSNLNLGAGLYCHDLYEPIEKLIGEPLFDLSKLA